VGKSGGIREFPKADMVFGVLYESRLRCCLSSSLWREAGMCLLHSRDTVDWSQGHKILYRANRRQLTRLHNLEQSLGLIGRKLSLWMSDVDRSLK
jgi:hypothetical protein